jgi:hypothetical protein
MITGNGRVYNNGKTNYDMNTGKKTRTNHISLCCAVCDVELQSTWPLKCRSLRLDTATGMQHTVCCLPAVNHGFDNSGAFRSLYLIGRPDPELALCSVEAWFALIGSVTEQQTLDHRKASALYRVTLHDL